MKKINCPLCHKKMDIIKNYYGSGVEYAIACTGCEIGMYAYSEKDLDAMIELWAIPDMESKQARIDWYEHKLKMEAECY